MLLLVFALTLVVAALVSERAERTVLSTAVLFLLVGIAFGAANGSLGAGVVGGLAELALVMVLFTDGMRLSLAELREGVPLPRRALLIGFPLTLALTALAARLLVDLSWPQALLVGAALAPTDPVFASAILGREEVPARLRQLLHVESGLNDGLALPFVVALMAWAGHTPFEPLTMGWQLALGVVLGVAAPWAAVRLERSAPFGAAEEYRRVGIFSMGLLVYALARVTHGNEFLAAFAAGVTVASLSPTAREAFAPLGGSAAELLKLAALLVFGSLLSPRFMAGMSAGGWSFVAVALFLARPLAIAVAFLGTPLTARERLVAAWFGPKGFASVVYGLLIAAHALPQGDLVFHLVAITTAVSIVLHSSTDVLVARWFERRPDVAEAG